MSFPRYERYKDSGVEWLSELPEHWYLKRLILLASINDDALAEDTSPDFDMEYVDISSVTPGSKILAAESIKFGGAPSRARRIAKNGDILVSTVRTYLRAIAPVIDPPENLIASTGFAVLRPREHYSHVFLNHALQAASFIEEVIARSTGVSYPAINAHDLSFIKLPLPPSKQDQERIGLFLETETTKIDKGNVHGPQRRTIGDIEKGFADADVTVEGEYFTQIQTHSALETHGFVVDWKPEEVTVYASTQGTASVRSEFADVFKLPKSKVRVITEYMGGGFGAKFGAGNEGVVAANLSRKANAPVKLMLDRRQEHIVCNRPDSHQKLRIGAKHDGTLTAIELISYGTAGVGTGAGTAGPATNMYKCPNLLTEEYDVFINAGPGAAFRAPGHPPGCFAFEQTIDDLAVKLNMDPLALREKIDDNPARKAERQVILERTNWHNRRPAGSDAGPIKRGMGIAQSVWYRFVSMNSSCEVRVSRDGSVELMSAVQDLGTGTKTMLAVVVAEEFGIPPSSVVIRIGDTRYPIGPDSGGSVTTGSISPAARNAAYQAKQKLFAAVASKLGTTPDNLAVQSGRVVFKNDASRSFTLKQVTAKMPTDEISAQATRVAEYSKDRITYGGVDYVELEVDTETGRVHIEKVFGAHDCGRPINPLGVISQINGGILQGISYALFEQRIMDRNAGYMLNANLENYKILGARETPEIEIALVENYIAQSSTDAAGIGESAGIITLAAAIGNAFYNATGVRMRKIPMTPANVLSALGKVQEVQA
jgi:xanthine dehydrogenase YagR molybdenum-binding subunit